MSLRSEKIPNKKLGGDELLEIAVRHFRDRLASDCMFSRQIAYGRVAFSIEATFHLGQPHQEHVVKSRVRPDADGVLEGEAPLALDGEEDASLIALRREVEIDNPNLARVHNGLPIKTVQKAEERTVVVESALPGEPAEVIHDFPAFTVREHLYDKDQYPPQQPAVDSDVSDRKAKQLGVRQGNKGGMGYRGK